MSARDESQFGITDLLLIQGIFALGIFGYLCDAHSPIVLPFLWVFGLVFAAELIILAGLIFRDSVVLRTHGWQAGLLFLLLPVIVAALYFAGLRLIRSWE